MALLILSNKVIKVEDTLKDVTLASQKRGLRLDIAEHRKGISITSVEVYIAKDYGGDDEYFYLGLESEEDVVRTSNLMDLKINGRLFYRLGVTDQASYDHLMYDFALEYLRLRPDQCISLYGDIFFFSVDMEKIESEGGYYKDWCYKPKV